MLAPLLALGGASAIAVTVAFVAQRFQVRRELVPFRSMSGWRCPKCDALSWVDHGPQLQRALCGNSWWCPGKMEHFHVKCVTCGMKLWMRTADVPTRAVVVGAASVSASDIRPRELPERNVFDINDIRPRGLPMERNVWTSYVPGGPLNDEAKVEPPKAPEPTEPARTVWERLRDEDGE